jgi:hypothetical protein
MNGYNLFTTGHYFETITSDYRQIVIFQSCEPAWHSDDSSGVCLIFTHLRRAAIGALERAQFKALLYGRPALNTAWFVI